MRVFNWNEITSGEGACFKGFLDVWGGERFGKNRTGERASAMTIGDFDGCHFGHRTLFSKVLGAANPLLPKPENGRLLVPGVVTFNRAVTGGTRRPQKTISTLPQKLNSLEKSGFVFAVLIDFSDDFSKMEGTTFFEILAENARLGYLAVGEDFRCGFRRGTGCPEIKRIARAKGFAFEPLPPVLFDGERISSTRIRAALLAADFFEAERLLGHPFALDISGIQWSRGGTISSDACGFEAARPAGFSAPVALFQQVLPPAGRYRAKLCAEAGEDASDCTCSVDILKDVLILRESEGGVPLVLTETAGLMDEKTGERYAGLRFITKIPF